MKVYGITSTNFNGGIEILAAENKGNEYLYNHIQKMTNEYKIPATFHNNKIELPSISKIIVEKLNELGIKFRNI